MSAINLHALRQTRLRWVIPIGIVIVTLIGVSIVFNRNTPSARKTKNTIDTQPFAETVRNQQTTEGVAQQKRLQLQPIAMSDPLAEIRPQLEALTKQQQSVHQRQRALSNQVQQHQVQIKEVQVGLAGINQQLTTQHDQLQQLQVARKKKVIRKTKSTKRHKPAVPQLILASIDQWGDTQTVVLEDAGQLVTLRNGERHRGWQVTHIDLDGQHVQLMSAQKQQLSLSLR